MRPRLMGVVTVAYSGLRGMADCAVSGTQGPSVCDPRRLRSMFAAGLRIDGRAFSGISARVNCPGWDGSADSAML